MWHHGTHAVTLGTVALRQRNTASIRMHGPCSAVYEEVRVARTLRPCVPRRAVPPLLTRLLLPPGRAAVRARARASASASPHPPAARDEGMRHWCCCARAAWRARVSERGCAIARALPPHHAAPTLVPCVQLFAVPDVCHRQHSHHVCVAHAPRSPSDVRVPQKRVGCSHRAAVLLPPRATSVRADQASRQRRSSLARSLLLRPTCPALPL